MRKILWGMLAVSSTVTVGAGVLLLPGLFQGYEPNSPDFEIVAYGFVGLVIIDGLLLKFATGEKFSKWI